LSNKSTNWRTVSYILLAGVIVVSLVAAAEYYSISVGTTGTIDLRTVGCSAYLDAAGTQPITSINWGQLPPNSAVNVTLYIKNTGNVPCNFTISTANWNPSNAPNYIGLTSDLFGAKNIAINALTKCVLTDSIAANVTGITSYSYDVVITASVQ
jgi:hypothetical protein